MGDLKPCPFCGSNRHKTDAGFRGRFVMCLDCFCQTRQKDDDESAIAAWNTRATPPEVTALVKASTALRDHIARWHDGGPVAGPEESRALFEALDDALSKWETANA